MAAVPSPRADALPSGRPGPTLSRPSSPTAKPCPMPKVRLSYDGWLALPPAVRKRLGLSTGHQLELELVGGAVVLRPADAARPPPPPPPAVPPPADPAATRPPVGAPPPATAPDPVPTVKRGPGRPRKVPAAVALPPNLRARGGRRKAASGKAGG